MIKFIDVTPDKWFSKDLLELSDVEYDDQNIFMGIPYNAFVEGGEAIDYEIINEVSGSHEFTIPHYVSPTWDNPLTVFVDNVTVAVNDIQPDQTSSSTFIRLARSVGSGSRVRFFYSGEPRYSVIITKNNTSIYSSAGGGGSALGSENIGARFNFKGSSDSSNWYEIDYNGQSGFVSFSESRKIPAGMDYDGAYPSASIITDSGFSYSFDPFNNVAGETVRWSGIQLERVPSRSDIRQGKNQYTVEGQTLYTNYHLNNQDLEVSILQTNNQGLMKPKHSTLKVSSDSVVYTNRMFPDISSSKAETIVLLNRLRKDILRRFTDGEYDTATTSSRFSDVQSLLDSGNTPWWWEHVSQIESLRLLDGRWVLDSEDSENLFIDAKITRAEVADVVNKFRLWCIECLK